VVESVYTAVRTDGLYKADYVSSLKVKNSKLMNQRECPLDDGLMITLSEVIITHGALTDLLSTLLKLKKFPRCLNHLRLN
jgi:hypothetical protein